MYHFKYFAETHFVDASTVEHVQGREGWRGRKGGGMFVCYCLVLFYGWMDGLGVGWVCVEVRVGVTWMGM